MVCTNTHNRITLLLNFVDFARIYWPIHKCENSSKSTHIFLNYILLRRKKGELGKMPFSSFFLSLSLFIHRLPFKVVAIDPKQMNGITAGTLLCLQWLLCGQFGIMISPGIWCLGLMSKPGGKKNLWHFNRKQAVGKCACANCNCVLKGTHRWFYFFYLRQLNHLNCT